MAYHKVEIDIAENGTFCYNYPLLDVSRGDKIRWKLDKNCAFSIIIKALDSPFDWGAKTAKKGRTIVGTVRNDAAVGFYSYAVTVVSGDEIVLDDPGLIVRR